MRLLLVLLICLSTHKGYAKRTKEKIYVDISTNGRAACFRRLNGTHQIGCSSDPKGNVGVVHYVNSSSDLDWLLDHGPHKPYAVLLNAVDFTMSTINMLRSSGKVNGIMVIHTLDSDLSITSPVPAAFSPDKKCPNDQYGLYKDSAEYKDCGKVAWNSAGDGMMFEDLGFPIFILTSEENVTFIIEKCYENFNKPNDGVAREYPLCAVQLKDRMDGAKDSETCIRRTRHQLNLSPDRYCDPMGDQNVYATVKNLTNNDIRPAKSVIIAAARMDSFSMFESYYPSADNHVSGIVALLAAAEVIGKVKDKIQASTKDIMFTFFQGEAFDYIGSGRMVYDMEKNNFPLPVETHLHTINLTHISHFVEVNQLAYRDGNKLWIHTDPLSRPNVSTQIDEMITNLMDIGQSLIDTVNQSQPLPPASVQSFLKKHPNIPAVVITDHMREFTNKYYNSRFDLAKEIKADYPESVNRSDWYDHVTTQAASLTEVSTMLARFLYKTATGENATDDIRADNSTVTHLLYCYLISPKCELFIQSLTKDNVKDLTDKPFPFYVGVATQTNHYSYLTKQMLLRYLGDIQNENITKDKCTDKKDDKMNHYTWMQGPLVNDSRVPFCVVGTANYSLASSVAFELDNYNYKSGEFSTWTESSWATDAMMVRFFLLPSKKFEVVTLVVGVLILIVSLCGGFFLHKKASIVFSTGSPDSTGPVSL